MNWTGVVILGFGVGFVAFARPLAEIRYRPDGRSAPPESGVRQVRVTGVLIAILGIVASFL